MRRLFFVLLLLVAAVVGLGFYLEWFSFASSRDPETGKSSVQFNIDTRKMKSDKEKVTKKLSKGESQTKEQPEEK